MNRYENNKYVLPSSFAVTQAIIADDFVFENM